MRARFLIIGGGVAGASAAAALAEHGTTLLLEAEAQPGYHATGRSAASFDETYGHRAVCAATRASRAFFWDPPPEFCDHPLVRPRAELYIGRPEQAAALERLLDEHAALEPVSPAEALRLCPILRPEVPWRAAVHPHIADMDVDAILQGCLRLARARGAQVVCDARASAVDRLAGGGWRVTTPAGAFEGEVVVNAAGAWAGAVGRMAGLGDLGLTPMRRTAIRLEPERREGLADWPFVIDVEERFYFRPDAGGLLVSPADETPSEPCDAQADELDVAYAVHHFEDATTETVRRVAHRWAGLRTFAPDRVPVVGADPRAPDFFWLAGQGGYGIMTSPAFAWACAGLLTRGELPASLRDQGLAEADLSPARLIEA